MFYLYLFPKKTLNSSLKLRHCCSQHLCVIMTTETSVGVFLCILWLRCCVVKVTAGRLLREHLTHKNNVLPPLHLLLLQPNQSTSSRHDVCMRFTVSSACVQPCLLRWQFTESCLLCRHRDDTGNFNTIACFESCV